MYGGTQEEMQRLLDDAEKLSGQKFDISSYSDIVDAIHVVQTEMGITGTTAKEASTTIQGSVDSMKSAWSNLITGIADDNADLDALIGNFVESAETAAGNIIPRITQILSGMGSAIEQLAPIIAAEIPVLISSVLPPMMNAGVQLIVGLVSGLFAALPALVAAVPSIIESFVTAILNNLPVILESGMELLSALTSGIIEYLPKLVAELPKIINSITGFFVDNFPKIVRQGGELLGKLLVGIIGAIPAIAVQLPAVITAIVTALEAGWEQLKEAGKYLLEGLWEGISNKIEWLKEQVAGLVDIIKSWFTGKDGFDEHSPSKWSKKVFQYVMEGGGEGLDAGLPGLMHNVGSVTDRVKSGLDFGTASVDFASSGLGISSAGIINNMSAGRNSGGEIPGKIELVLKSEEGKTFGRWMVPFIRSEDKSNPEVVSDAV